MPNVNRFPYTENRELDHLAKGTRQQYESEWTRIPDGGAVEFRHELDEIPWTVSLLRSDDSDGKFAVAAAATDFTITYADEAGSSDSGMSTLTVTSGYGSATYIKVRAM